MKIGVFGLGYVGNVNVACFSKLGKTVYCTDVKKHKIQYVKEGKSPIFEPELESLIKEGVTNGNIIATDNVAEIVKNADILVTCVGTPSKPDGEVNLDYLNNVIIEICSYLKPEDKKYIVFRSTVPPGTTEYLTQKYIANQFPHVQTVFFPEFLREGTAVKDFFSYGRFVLGAEKGEDVASIVSLLHVNSNAPIFLTDYRTAEYAKYIDNSFHALKVVFANEIFGLGVELGVNIEESHQIFVADNKLNISHRYLKPGTPFGGSCLPKDVREIQHLKNKSRREFKLLESLIPSNEKHIQHLIEMIESFGKTKIGFIGLTFKNYSDDLRESPILKILLELRKKNNKYELSIHDSDINLENVRIEFPYLFSGITDLATCIEQSELLVVSKRYLQEVLDNKKNGQIVVNLSDNITADKEQLIYNPYKPFV